MDFVQEDKYQKYQHVSEQQVVFEGGNDDEDGFVKQDTPKPSQKKKLPEEFTAAQGLWMIMKQSLTPIFSSLFHPSYMMVNVKLLGHMEPDTAKCEEEGESSVHCMSGNQFQAAFGMGSSTIGIILLASGLCFVLGLNTVIAQAYGSGNYRLCGAYRNRMIILSSMIFVPFLIPLQFISYFFISIGLDQNVSDQAATYVRVIAPGVIVYLWGMAYSFYSTQQGKPHFTLYSTVSASICHVFMSYYFCVYLDWKMFGVALSSSIHLMIRSLVLFFACSIDKDLQRCELSLMHPDSWKDLGEMWVIGRQTFMVKVMGWWAFDVFTQMAAFTGETNITAAQSILRNIGLYTFMIPVGISISCNFFVGTYIGMNLPGQAKRMSTLCNIVANAWAIASILFVFSFDTGIMGFYSQDNNVTEKMKQAWPVLLVFIYFDCMQAVANSNIQGLGLVKKVTWVTMFDYWALGIPLSLFTMFHLDWKLAGLWMGPTLACAMNFAIYYYYINGADWDQISKDTVQKMEDDRKKLEEKQ